MKEISIEDWGNNIFNKIFIVKRINYNNGKTVVYDTIENITYGVTYDGKKMILEVLYDDEET